MKFSKSAPYWLLTIAALIGLTVPVLIQDGMFLDGILYSCISHNLSQGIGSFWNPYFSEYGIGGLTTFHEHPPLAFGIQALFYKLLGGNMYTERIYTFLMLLLNAFLIHVLWRTVFRRYEYYGRFSWLPVLLWISIPLTFWSFSNNMLENTMSVFILLAVLFCYKAFDEKRVKNSLIAGAFVFLATFTKGLPGFFPLAVPFITIVVLSGHSFKKAIRITCFMLIPAICAYGVLLLFQESRESLRVYVSQRLLGRIDHTPTVHSRFFILKSLLMEPLVLWIIALLSLAFFVLRKKTAEIKPVLKFLILFMLIGLCGSLPLMLTKVQKAFYYTPALPFFAMAVAVLCIPFATRADSFFFSKKIRHRVLWIFSVFALLFTIGLSISKIGKVSRDRALLADVRIIGRSLPEGTVINASIEARKNMSLQCYLVRYYNIGISKKDDREYYLGLKNQAPMSGYLKINLPTTSVDLYESTKP